MRALAATLAGVALAAGCASQPELPEDTATALAEAENAVAQASTPEVKEYAPVDLQRAQETLSDAQSAGDAGDEWLAQHNARMAERHAQIAEAKAATRAAQVRADELEEQRDELRLQAREQSLSQQQRELNQQQEKLSQKEREIRTLREQLSELQPRETERGIVLTLSHVLFAFDSAELDAAASQPLDALAKFLREHPDRQTRVEGHTDSTGSQEYNLRLSRARAQSVADALAQRGIPRDRVTVAGYGESRPVASNETETGRQQNRRVEFVILD